MRMINDDLFIEINEGNVVILGPNLERFSDSGRIEPCWAPVFYNPAMKMDRDISICVLSAFQKLIGKGLKICEALSATGVRGLRYAKEVGNVERIFLNDVNSLAYNLIKINVFKNGLSEKVTVFHTDANVLLAYFARRGRRFNVVDIDPFGSPVPFLDNAIRAVENKGLLCVTATDLAPLMGVYKKACLRKYGAYSIKTEFSQEIGLRILIGYIARTAAKYGVGITPLFSYYRRHYMRVFAQVRIGKKLADKSLSEIGYLAFCPKCGRIIVQKSMFFKKDICEKCEKEMEIIGPLWLGKTGIREFIKDVINFYQTRKNILEKKGLILLSRILEEIELPPYFYTTSYITRKYNFKREPSLPALVNELKMRGFKASLTHFSSKGFKTNASISDIVEIFKLLQNI